MRKAVENLDVTGGPNVEGRATTSQFSDGKNACMFSDGKNACMFSYCT